VLKSINDLRHFEIFATDGEIGSVSDVLFDDREWVVRYLAVHTGGWLSGRDVLISPVSVRNVDDAGRQIHVALTQQQVRNSPDVQTQLPVSRQHENELATYYAWPLYWEPPGMGGGGVGWTGVPPIPLEERHTTSSTPPPDPNLRSARDVKGYYIMARDGDIGHVEDFIADDQDWTIRYLEIDTRNWLPGKSVLIPPQWVQAVDWENNSVHIDLEREVIRQSPEYRSSEPIAREFERRLHDYFGRPRYWEESVAARRP
jgi:sporulation protein YlmC with PRC-barrel domain